MSIKDPPERLLILIRLDYYSVVDSLTSRLKSTGMLGVCDFYGKLYIEFLHEYYSFKI